MNTACVKKAGLQYVEKFRDKKWSQYKVRQIQWDLEEEDSEWEHNVCNKQEKKWLVIE